MQLLGPIHEPGLKQNPVYADVDPNHSAYSMLVQRTSAHTSWTERLWSSLTPSA